ncbi:N-acetylmuramoyl-L-alanine amidase [Aerococcaceae bacterium zg-ZUI334]|uniref:N-acetylmuramoyl-L-alanine amidase n=1 Tax=Aerococcaceae TaxID=186827 RepID=UPI0013BC203A|nr:MULTISPECIES: N-acetylmuramoyl-L-alanine amidase [unclassified Facklamia]MBR7926867.1 N-acetylmuramoyl-L-alanine amidase [Aerococcaceae bacterium zg-ZUI334]NEW64821.1 SH3 domain-containing protein [Facklamia sp. 252]NEW68143.1 SH3 domain-containing protein [Facklamia sp. 253]QQD64974.1 N-acetylmuramoyl-L-alanine amidase [Aerococcaceae bacterium zg-252]
MDNQFKRYINMILSPKYFPPIITFTILCLSLLALSQLITHKTIVIEREQVTVRFEPATNAESVGETKKGDELIVLAEDNGWIKVRLDSQKVGWIPKWYLENTTLKDDQNLAAQLLVDTPIYMEKDDKSSVLATVSAENYLIVRHETKGWLQVEYNGLYGYIRTRMVNVINQSDIPKSEEELAKEAEQIVVVRYAGEPLFEKPAFDSTQLYSIAYGQKFKYLDEVESYDANGVLTYFLHVEDSEGLQGYVESRISAMESDSIGHVTEKTVNSLANATIMLDPGHGGADSGAVSTDGTTYEKNAALATALTLKQKLEAIGAKVILTRSTDEFIDLIPRSDLSNEKEVDAFISLHYDEGPYADWRGTTTYYFHEADHELAKKINDALKTSSLPNNGALFGNYSVLRENKRQAILIELGYMSSPEDLQYIRSDKYYDEVATLITTALENYFKE